MIGILMLLFSLCLLAGCSHKVIITAETYTLEAGTKLPESPETYASFASAELAAEAVVQADQVDTGKVGTYEAAVVLNGKAYPFAVEVVDTRAPEGSLGDWFALAKEAVKPEDFAWEYTDASEVVTGFRNAELVMSPEELTAVFQEEGVLAEGMTPSELLDFSWSEETDTWEEEDAGTEDLTETFEPEEDGLYCLELAAVDAYGNAFAARCYVLLDREAPVISGVEDLVINFNQDRDMDIIKEAVEDITVSDNLLGDITDFLELDFDIQEEDENHQQMKLFYVSTDLCGNQATAEQTLEINLENQGQWVILGGVPGSSGSSLAEGYHQDMARDMLNYVNTARAAEGLNALVWDDSLEELAKKRAQEIVSNFSHDGCPGYAGENILQESVDSRDISQTHDFWMNSPGHRANILLPEYTKIGIACYTSGGRNWWVENFIY